MENSVRMPESLPILAIASSDGELAPLLAALRAAGYAPEYVRVNTAAMLYDLAHTQQWHVVLYCDPCTTLDLGLLLRLLRQQHVFAPTIVVSEQGGEAAAVAAIKAGANNVVAARDLERFTQVVAQELGESSGQRVLSDYDEQMRFVLAHANCLLWSGTVYDPLHPSNLMHWETEVFDVAAAQRFAPIECLPDEPYTAAWYRHRLPEDQTYTDHVSTQALRSNAEQYTHVFRCRLRDGTVRWYNEQVRVAPLSPSSWQVVGIAIDITERKQTEERLSFIAEASALLTQSLDIEIVLRSLAKLCTPVLADMCIVDICEEDGSLWRVAAHHTNPAKASVARELEQRFPLDPNGTHPALHVMRTGEAIWVNTVDTETVLRSTYNADHRRIVEQLGYKSYMIVPFAAHEQVLGVVTLVATEAPRSYDASQLELAREIANRAAIAVENAKLYRHAQEAIQTRETFLSIAAHELRTPLTSLLGNAQVLERRGIREGLFVERDQRNLAAIITQGNRLNRLIELLLDVSRMQQDRLQLDLAPVDLSVVVERVVEEMQPMLRYHRFALHCQAGVLVVGDELRLEQVLHNLLSNAIKYTREDGAISIELAREGSMACFAITDQGIGIPQQDLPRLFTQFYRASNVDPKQISGLGIGLHLVYEVVARHNGTIEVESVEGQGSRFTVMIPIAGPRATTQKDTAV